MHDSDTSPIEIRKLETLDKLLKCGICYEYLKTTLITPCSHNFCSYCIRQSLSYKNQCPSCFEDVHEAQLRNNRVVDEFTSIFCTIKEKIFKFLKYLPNSKVSGEKLDVNNLPSKSTNSRDCISENVVAEPSTEQNRVGEVVNNGFKHTNCSPSTSKKHVIIPALFSPKKPKTLSINETKVPCPVCSVEIPEKNINIHLDACLKHTQETRVSQEEKRKPLPKLVYHLLPDKDLRKKLSELGLSNLGDRAALINRHKRYTLLYNSECDTLHPKSVSDIIKQMKKEEEEEKKSVPTVTKKYNIDRKADPQVIEEAQRQYLQEHKSSFQKLIEEARRNKEARKNNKEVVVPEPPVFAVEETSNSSDEFQIKASHKRKLISSDSEEETKGNAKEVDCRIATTSDDHKGWFEEQTGNKHSSDVISDTENEIVILETDNNPSKAEDAAPNVFDDSTDMESDDNLEKNFSQELTTKCRRKKSDVLTLQSSPCFNSLASVTSPVIGTKCRSNRTVSNPLSPADSIKRKLLSDFNPKKDPAGQDFVGEEVESDSSSNHSTSLLMYTGPDCDSIEQSELNIPSKSNCNSITSSTTEKCHFDLGIEEILQNSEELERVPARRRSARRGGANPTETGRGRGRGGRVLRKRVRLDDL